jgi:hypothetical protein
LEAFHDYMWTNAVLYVASNLFQELGSKQDDARCAIPNLRILSTSDVDQGSGSGMDNIQQFQDCRAIVRDLSLSTT